MVEIKHKISKGEVIIYEAKDGPRIDVRLEQETVWLDAHQIALLFDVNRPAIVKHIPLIDILIPGSIFNKNIRSLLIVNLPASFLDIFPRCVIIPVNIPLKNPLPGIL